MNLPHFAFGFAANFPFAQVIVVVMLVSLVTSKDPVRLPINSTTVLLIVFPLWMCVTYIFALENEIWGLNRWQEVMKIFFVLLISAAVIKTRQHVIWMIWVIAISIGFFGVKGGIFTLLGGGSSRVYGPPGSTFISDNNSIAVAIVMVIPLMYFLRSQVSSKWLKLAMLGAMGLSFMAVLGTQSRGALFAVSAMVAFLWLKSGNKFLLGIFMVALIPIAIGFMPSHWTDRMKTIESYKQDSSAMGRINAWRMAINVANDRPLVGGGFELYTRRVFAKYAPDPLDVHAAHSIYFQILGEHGYVGLAIFLAIGFVGWRNASRIIKLSGTNAELAWAGELARMIQVSLIGYAAGGIFVNIGYWENLYYEILVIMVVHSLLVSSQSPSAALRKREQSTPVSV